MPVSRFSSYVFSRQLIIDLTLYASNKVLDLAIVYTAELFTTAYGVI